MNARHIVPGRGNILIVDAQSAQSQLLETMLQDQGYDVRSIASGQKVLELLKSGRPDLLNLMLLGVDLGDISGYEVCQQLKSSERTRTIPVIFTCTEGAPIDRARLFAVGGVDYIVQPFLVEEVLHRVTSHIALQRIQKRLQEQNHQLEEQKFHLQREIAERRRIEMALKESEERYTRAVETGGVGIWDWNLETNEMYIAPNLKSLLGYHDHEIHNHLNEWMRLICPDDQEEVMRKLKAYLQGVLSSYEVEHRVCHKDGTIRWFHIRGGSILRDQHNNKPVRLSGTMTDISERKQAEDSLRISQQLINSTFASMRDAVFIIDAETTKILDCNPAATEIFGYNREELLGSTTSLLHVDAEGVRAFKTHLIESINRAETHHVSTCVMQRKDGTLVHTEHSVRSLHDHTQKHIGWVNVIRDISESKRVEDALNDREERFRLLAENARDIIFRYRFVPTRGFEYISPAVKPIMGYTPEEYYANPDMDLKTLHPDHRIVFGVVSQSANAYREPVTMRHIRKDGTDVWIEQNHWQIVDERGRIVAIEGIARDITERKRSEELMRQAQEDLERRVQERTADLETLTAAYAPFVPREFLSLLQKENIVELELGDQIQREMTIMFSDIRSFTVLSEKMTPEENFQFINKYLSRVSPAIREHGGVIDKYIGDAIMALFPRCSEDALQAAIAMLAEVNQLNEELQAEGNHPITIGIALHTGSLMLGIIGEEQRKEVTVIADAVNLAARLEGLTKLYGASIVISESTLFHLDHATRYQFRFLDKVKVKGKEEPVSVFEILDGNPESVATLKLKTRTDFEKALLHYHHQEFREALVYFNRVLAVDYEDRAAQMYLQRATRFLEEGVPLSWDGVEIMKEK